MDSTLYIVTIQSCENMKSDIFNAIPDLFSVNLSEWSQSEQKKGEQISKWKFWNKFWWRQKRFDMKDIFGIKLS